MSPKPANSLAISRVQFYEIRRNFQTFGSEGLIDRLQGAKNFHPSWVSEEVENAVLYISLKFPTQGPARVAQYLTLQGIQVSSGGARVMELPRGSTGPCWMSNSGSRVEASGTRPLRKFKRTWTKYLKLYNYERPHRGRNMNGCAPYEVFKNGTVKTKLEVEPWFPEAA